MEYEIYWLCNLIGIIVIAIIIFFHFLEADKKPKKVAGAPSNNPQEKVKSK